MADRARQKTEKSLRELERRIKALYSNSPSLRRIQNKLEAYMKWVGEQTHDAYLEYRRAPIGSDEKRELKKVYTDAVKELTLNSKKYKDLTSELTRILSELNSEALALTNSEMTDIYVENYNQVAVDCKKVGIEVYE